MFESGVAVGERVAVWRAPSVEPEPRLRVLLPGQGATTRDRANAATFVPSVQQAARKATKGPGGRRTGRGSTRRRVPLPGDPTASETALARWRGHPGGGRPEMDRALRLGLINRPGEVGEAFLDLGCWRYRIGAMAPGPELVAALAERPDELAPAPVKDPDEALWAARAAGAADVADRVVTGWANAVLESITARARVLSWLQAEQYTDLALLSRNYPGLAEMLPTEVGFALRTSDAIAGNAISTARAISMRLPGTLEALRAGLIDSGHAMAMVSATCTTTAQVAAEVEADLLPVLTAPGSTMTAEQLRRRAVRRVIARDPDGAADRHRTAKKDRTMTRWIEDDGMAGLKVFAPAQQIAAIWEAATALADAAKTPGDERTLGARRVDSISDVCLDILAGTTPTPGLVTPATPAPAAPRPEGTTPPTPAQSGPAQSGPAQSGPAQSGPAQSGPAQSGPAQSGPAQSGPAQSGPAQSGPAQSGPAQSGPAQSGPAQSGPAEGRPSTVPDSPTADAAASPGRAQVEHQDLGPSDVENRSPSQDHGPGAADDETPTAAPRDLPALHGRRPHIQVLVPYTVLLGADDPCELAGHGAITADQARTIIADGVLQRLLYDPTSGIVLDYGRTRYEPPQTLKQFIIARDRTCRTPGCLRPAERCQIDHVEPFRPGQPPGGCTCHRCLDAKCLHHHRAKDGGGFLNTRDPDGTTHWTTPLGRTYTLPPPQIIDPLENDPDDRFPPELKAHKSNGSESDSPHSGCDSLFPAGREPQQANETSTPSDDEPPF